MKDQPQPMSPEQRWLIIKACSDRLHAGTPLLDWQLPLLLRIIQEQQAELDRREAQVKAELRGLLPCRRRPLSFAALETADNYDKAIHAVAHRLGLDLAADSPQAQQ